MVDFSAFSILIVISLVSLSKSIIILSPSFSLDVIISSASASSTYFCMARFSGLAPYCLSKPLSAIKSLAVLVNSNSYPRPLMRIKSFSNSISIILLMSSFSSALKTTTSSILFKNSGAKDFFNAFWITARAFASS